MSIFFVKKLWHPSVWRLKKIYPYVLLNNHARKKYTNTNVWYQINVHS